MSVYENLIDGNAKLAVVGLGYVGLPIAVAFSRHIDVVGFDVNERKIAQYLKGNDPTGEVGDDAIRDCDVFFTSDERDLDDVDFFVIAVPTPVNSNHTPDLRMVESASRIVGRHLHLGAIAVYESTVYPGVTEDVCIPILEEESHLSCPRDFKVGFSPERINPGDQEHRLNTIVKIVSGIDDESCDEIAKVYELVVDAGVHKAESIMVAEAAKVIENSQRDINIAFMNELSLIFHKLGIDTQSVLRAANTKWNFLDFKPGLVGGHCIGVDPYYLTHRAEEVGYHSQVILAGRRINDNMGIYVANELIKCLSHSSKPLGEMKVAVLGFTFKEDCPDTRNTRVIDIIRELEEFGIEVLVVDPVADPDEMSRFYGIDGVAFDDLADLDAVVVATAHDAFRCVGVEELAAKYDAQNNNKVLFDVKGIMDKDEMLSSGFSYWRL